MEGDVWLRCNPNFSFVLLNVIYLEMEILNSTSDSFDKKCNVKTKPISTKLRASNYLLTMLQRS